MGFNDAWQLDVNTATAVELMLMTTFLQNTKRRHRLYMHRCISLISLIDDETEARLDAAALENQVISLKACQLALHSQHGFQTTTIHEAEHQQIVAPGSAGLACTTTTVTTPVLHAILTQPTMSNGATNGR